MRLFTEWLGLQIIEFRKGYCKLQYRVTDDMINGFNSVHGGVLFAAALFVKGFTHDLVIEAGVLLVSIKLILMVQRNARSEENLERHLLRIEELLVTRTASGNSLKET